MGKEKEQAITKIAHLRLIASVENLRHGMSAAIDVQYIKDRHHHNICYRKMVSPLVVVMGVGFFGFAYNLCTNETPNTVQPSPEPKPEPKPAVLDSGKTPLTNKRKTEDKDHTKKKRKTRDLVHAKNFDSSSDEEEEDPPNKEPVAKAPGMVKKIINTAKNNEFVKIDEKKYFYSVRADGRCLFRAIVAAMHFLNSEEKLDEETEKADDLRNQIVTFMLNNPDKFGNTPEESECLEEYCEEMMMPKTHGRYSEVCAFHFMKGMQVEVYHLENDSLKIMHCINDHCKPGVDDVIRLFYNGKDHWDMLYFAA